MKHDNVKLSVPETTLLFDMQLHIEICFQYNSTV